MVVPYRTNARSLALLAIMISVFLLAHGQAFPECGGYHFVNPGESKIITSPNHPDAYPEYSRCIWVARTQENYRVRFTITYRGERFNGSCADYVEVRDGGQFAPLLATFCDNSTNEQVTSGYIYMWVLFSSDAQQTYGSPMSATFTAYYNASPPDNTTKPFTDCRSYEFECSNSMCASMSYRCDAYNDCGCKAGCDEDKCYDLVISKAIQIVVSLAVGVVTFVMVAIFSFLLEGQHSWITALAEAVRPALNSAFQR
ncbi:tolloid-like protein 1 [Plakobranchus ocellatus]|uniref:Tolloid-like protein 1 n=1 Tax=Plakobranchus ocellatus TaxID=259542 RepID=A0AAV4BZJ5_9GAST|nr:tolloid-like protein 1 [Plakobranchus ocellatus]